MDVKIDTFAQNISDEDLSALYARYRPSNYGHLTKFPITPRTKEEQILALKNYLTKFTIFPATDEERYNVLKPLIELQDYQGLAFLVANDQYFEEPLIHILNQGLADYNLEYDSVV